MSWGKDQVKGYIKELRKDLGKGAWEWMSVDMRKAVVSERAFQIARCQALESVRVDAMDQLWRDMMYEAGLRDPGEDKP